MKLSIRNVINGLAATAVLIGSGLVLPAVAHAGNESAARTARSAASTAPPPTGGAYTFDNASADTLQLIANNRTGQITAPPTIAPNTSVEMDEAYGQSGYLAYTVQRGGVTVPGHFLVILVTESDGTDRPPICDSSGLPSGISCKATGPATITFTDSALGSGPPVAISGVTQNGIRGSLTLTSSSASGGTFTTPPGRVVRSQAKDPWAATVPAGGSVSLTYRFSGRHTVTFTNPAAGSGTCTITPADPGYTCIAGAADGNVTDSITQSPISQFPPVTGQTVNGTAGTMALTGTTDHGGTFTTPPAGTLGTGATDHWVATVPASGAIAVTYAFDGVHSVTFTDAGTSQNCAIAPADPGYSCTTGGTTQAPIDTLIGPVPVAISGVTRTTPSAR